MTAQAAGPSIMPGSTVPAGALGWMWRDRRARIALLFLGMLVLVALFAPLVAPRDPAVQDFSAMFSGPSSSHWLGTDDLGRDTWSRLVFGTRASLEAAGVSVAVALLIGVPLGLMAGFSRGWLDAILMRVVDAVLAFPAIVLAVGIVAVLGPGLFNAMCAVGVIFSPSIARVVRAQVLAITSRLYVEAARAYGSGYLRTLLRHVLPNSMQPVVVQATTLLGLGLLAEASLSFIGLGVQPPDSSWGTMLQRASQFVDYSTFQVLPPGLAITAAVVAFNSLGDSMRDALDPITAERNRIRHATRRRPRLPSGSTNSTRRD